MEAFQQRVVDEKTELDGKCGKLDAFFTNAIYLALPKDEQERLVRQRAAMWDYSAVLGERIAAFK